MPKPTEKPNWTAVTNTSVEPTTGKKEAGFAPEERPAAQTFNWFWRNVSEWIDFVDEPNIIHLSPVGVGGAGYEETGTSVETPIPGTQDKTLGDTVVCFDANTGTVTVSVVVIAAGVRTTAALLTAITGAGYTRTVVTQASIETAFGSAIVFDTSTFVRLRFETASGAARIYGYEVELV